MVSIKFCLQVDESTLPDNEALLLAYVKYFRGEKTVQEMPFARTLIAVTKGQFIFNTVKNYFKEKNILLVNIMSVATDKAPKMVDRHRGFIAFFSFRCLLRGS